MKKIYMIFFLYLIILCGCANFEKNSSKSQREYTRDIFAMDTYMHLKAYGEHADIALGYASEQILSLEKFFSVTETNSDIWTINHAQGKSVSVSDDTISLLEKAVEIGEKSNGALDVTIYPLLTEWGFTTDKQQVPNHEIIAEKLQLVDYKKISISGNTVQLPRDMQLDFGALAKGYTSDCVTDILKKNGVKSALVNLGGNVHAVGSKPDGSLWKVGVQNPFSPSEQVCILEIADKAVITSGNYERFFTDDNGEKYWHILDSSDGYPADNGLVSVTIIGDNGLLCDGLSTALFVLGTEKAIDYWKNSSDFEMVLITDDEKIYYSEGIADSVQFTASYEAEVIWRE